MLPILEPLLSDFVEGSVGWLIQRYIDEARQPGASALGESHEYTLRRLQRAPIGTIQHTTLKPLDFIDHCKARRATGVLPQTVNQDMTYLSGVLKYAVEVWELPETGLAAYRKAKPQLVKQQLIAKAPSRDRRPTQDELDRLLAYFDEQAKNPRTKIPMRSTRKCRTPRAGIVADQEVLLWHPAQTGCVIRPTSQRGQYGTER